jgi:hypothetical protein
VTATTVFYREVSSISERRISLRIGWYEGTVGQGKRLKWRKKINMATMTTSPPDERTSQPAGRATGRGTRRIRATAEEKTVSGVRFFLPKSGASGHAPELGREFPSEGEARVEALKLGVTYYSLQEWRPVADFAGKNPELKREAVTRKGTP